MDIKTKAPKIEEGVPPKSKTYTLKEKEELRFQVLGKEKIDVELVTGLAELFGTELIIGKKYGFFGGTKAAIYTWHGCTIKVTGVCSTTYVHGDTEMIFYSNIHGALEVLRDKAKDDNARGPFVLVVGSSETGKSTLSRILCNYAVRRRRHPILADLNVASNSVAIPGSIGVKVCVLPSDVEEHVLSPNLLTMHFGSTSPDDNITLYHTLITSVSQAVQEKMNNDPIVKSSGAIINTGSWVSTDDGYDSLLFIANAFNVSVVLVLDDPPLGLRLINDFPSSVKVVQTPKTKGMFRKDARYREELIEDRIKKYFYGCPKWLKTTKYFPQIHTIKFEDIKIYKAELISIPASCLPIGMEDNAQKVKLDPIELTPDLNRHLLAISHATSPQKAISSNLMGFVCVTSVEMAKDQLRVLSHFPPPLPQGKIIIYSNVQYVEAD
ncbi:protein CLP1 homolog [Brevipalpus obovatus]|uniref:protein CLP1 homolog n=1 Tax=Brevipalpus obovatus TaxID=246614 RepID=UPI003D9F1539